SSSLRAQRLAGAQGHRAVLDPLVLPRAHRIDCAQGAVVRVVVVGAAKTGIAVARFCAARGDDVIVNDKTEAIRAFQLPAGVKLELGGHPAALFQSADLIVISPGVPTDLPELVAARKASIEVIGEIELAARQVKGPIVAITGTNGKSTTTALCGEICGGFT